MLCKNTSGVGRAGGRFVRHPGEGLLEAPALVTGNVEDVRLVSQTVDDGTGEDGILEKGLPVLEGEVGGDDNAAFAVAVGEQVEQQLTAGLVEGYVTQFIQNN